MPSLLVIRSNPNTRQRSAQQDSHGRVEISPTALGFLIPLFILFIFGPIAVILWVRTRRQNQRFRGLVSKKPLAERRENARKELESVAEALNVSKPEKFAYCNPAEGDRDPETASVQGNECVICLTSLHAPAPPEPAKLSTEAATVDEEAVAPSTLETSPRENEILRLKVCSHEFHAECLISWFIIRKYSCPICRAVYYKNAAQERKPVGVRIDSRSARGTRPSASTERRENV